MTATERMHAEACEVCALFGSRVTATNRVAVLRDGVTYRYTLCQECVGRMHPLHTICAVIAI